MAGAHITVTLDDADYLKVLGRLAAFGGNVLRETNVDLGEALKNSHEDRFKAQRDPDGVPWVQLSDNYKRWKDKKRPGLSILKFDRHMLGDMFSYEASDVALELGTNAVYGALHQFGGTSDMPAGPAAVPARPFLGIGAEDGKLILEILGEHLQAAIDDR
jgi:phage virion morphogenesis protein